MSTKAVATAVITSTAAGVVVKANESQIARNLELYMESLSEKDLHAYAIAKNHLGNSFNIKYSNGFRNFKPPEDTIAAAAVALETKNP